MRITNTRAILDNRTYSMANLTTVTVGVTYPNKSVPIVLLVVGALVAIGGFTNSSPGAGVFGVMLLAVGIVWLRALKDTYHVRIGSAGGESNALSSYNKAYIQSVAQALNEAIVHRG